MNATRILDLGVSPNTEFRGTTLFAINAAVYLIKGLHVNEIATQKKTLFA